MLARALIVLLVVLNIGVATWWATRSDTPTVTTTAVPLDGVERLQLSREVPRRNVTKAPSPATPSQSPATSAAAATIEPAVAVAPVLEQCYSLGPFADAAAGEAARKRLQPRASRLHVRQAASVQARDWRVWLPPLAERAAAQAMASRISAAGFDDYYIVAAGDEANSIALGRYRSEESARRHEAALHAGGFAEVRAEALGPALPPQAWIDVAVTTPFDAAERSALGGAGIESVDCKTVP